MKCLRKKRNNSGFNRQSKKGFGKLILKNIMYVHNLQRTLIFQNLEIKICA